MNTLEIAQAAKHASFALAASKSELRNNALRAVADALENALLIRIEKTGEESRRITLEGVDENAFIGL